MLLSGDDRAYSELVVNFQQDLYKIARTRLSSEDDICDAVQETIVKAYIGIKNLRKAKYFKTWIIRILINECNSLYKSKNRLYLEEYDFDRIGSSDEISNKNSELDFNSLIRNLNYDERIAVTLFYLEELTTKQISKILDEPESTIRNRISRARNKLKKFVDGGDLYE